MKRVSKVILLNPNKQFLLYKRDNKKGLPDANKWDLFGGALDEGESIRGGLERELEEEGVDLNKISGLRYLFSQDLYNEKGDIGACCYFFSGEIEFNSYIELTEGQKYKFFNYGELFKLDLPKGIKKGLLNYTRN